MSIDFDKLKEQGYMRYFMDNKIPEDFLIYNADEFDEHVWNTISSQQNLSEDFIEKFQHLLCWRRMSKHQILSEGFINKHLDKMYLSELGAHNVLPNSFVQENINKFKFFYIIASRKWDENEPAYLLISFKSQNYFSNSLMKTHEKVSRMKETIESKTKYGSQIELPFTYPKYKTNLELRDLYLERINHNMDILLNFTSKWNL